MDIVYIRALQIETVIGIYDWERRIKQQVLFDLEMATDIRRAASQRKYCRYARLRGYFSAA